MIHNFLKLRKLATYVVTAVLLMVCNDRAKAQMTLASGDLVFVGYNMADNMGSTRTLVVKIIPLTIEIDTEASAANKPRQ